MTIICSRIYKTFKSGLGKKEVHAVSDVSFEMERGKTVGIVGPNGAGKSTLLKMFMGFIFPSSGTISLFGKSPEEPDSRKKMGYLPENPCFYEHLSAVELMQFCMKVAGFSKKDSEKQILKLLKLMNIEHAGNRKIRNYSKGMVQRAGICFALIHNPEFIILDEPMNGLDPVGRKLLVDLILDLKREGKTILFCSHILNDVERLCDSVAVMHKGKLKNIFQQSDFMKQGQVVQLVLEKSSQNSINDLKKFGIDLIDCHGSLQISCQGNQLNNVMEVISHHKLKILNITKSENILEKFFLDSIRNEEVLEVCQ